MEYTNMIKRWFDIRIKASNTRINCAAMYISAGTYWLGIFPSISLLVFMVAIPGALWAIRDKQDG